MTSRPRQQLPAAMAARTVQLSATSSTSPTSRDSSRYGSSSTLCFPSPTLQLPHTHPSDRCYRAEIERQQKRNKTQHALLSCPAHTKANRFSDTSLFLKKGEKKKG
jgi:hypothetical protein